MKFRIYEQGADGSLTLIKGLSFKAYENAEKCAKRLASYSTKTTYLVIEETTKTQFKIK